jgi:glycosyltransferase involved in cell wall biosynthesis
MAKIILAGSAYPFRGGLAAFNERLCRELTDAGHDVEIYTFTLQYPPFLFPGKSQYSDSPPPAGLKIARKVNSINPVNWFVVGNEIRKARPDLLLFKFWLPFMAPCFGTIARRAKGNGYTTVISILDNVIPHEKRIGDVAFTRYFLSSCDGFVTMSSAVTEELKQLVPHGPVVQHPHPLYDHFGSLMDKEEAKHRLGLDPQFNYLLFFGFIRKYKGLDLAIRAMADTEIRTKNLKLIVAGEFYEDPAPYHELISQLGLQDRIILRTEFIPDDEVSKYFSAADLLVLPYRSSTQSGVTQIASHFNKPVIVTRVGGLPEFVEDSITGFCTEPNPSSIAGCILKFYAGAMEGKMSLAIEERKKKYSWNSFAEMLIKLYSDVKKPA